MIDLSDEHGAGGVIKAVAAFGAAALTLLGLMFRPRAAPVPQPVTASKELKDIVDDLNANLSTTKDLVNQLTGKLEVYSEDREQIAKIGERTAVLESRSKETFEKLREINHKLDNVNFKQNALGSLALQQADRDKARE